ncbi:sensor histidine kinase [Actinokineospora xionganensis]|uniref:Histidine kinase n=1 Tax=Actinokineospora xionganensis TaxID=2684470 RepID=A0ABR7LCY3_9PSEU|nr:histidine kinase [Actinokineospora xionganensis]MBC6450530.1 histidine kinase [Actinokineospora xionganensis]
MHPVTVHAELPGGHDGLVGPVAPKGDSYRVPLIAPFLARAITVVVFLTLGMFAFLQIATSGVSVGTTVRAAGYLLVMLTLQLFYFSRVGAAARSPMGYAALGVQAYVSFVPLSEFGDPWLPMPLFLAATTLLVLPRVIAWAAVTAILAIVVGKQWVLTGSLLDVSYLTVGFIGVTLYLYGLTRLGGLITALHEARSELGKVAVARERTRFARDLHDLLGLSLAAIGPKGSIARRALAGDPDRARKELGEILAVSRHALADVRLIASGYREMSLHEESRTVESLLAASNVDVRMELNHGELPVHIRSLIVAVLRAGVANVLDHTGVARCEIALRQAGRTVTLDIIDDGMTGMCPLTPDADLGLENLVERVTALGGELVVGPDPDGRFGLHLTIPVSREHADAKSEPDEVEQIPRFASLFATGLMNVVFVGMAIAALLHLTYLTRDAVVLTVSGLCMAGLAALQLFYVSKPGTRFTSPTKYLVIAAQAAMVYVPALLFPHAWISIPGMLAGTVLLVLRPVAGWIGFGAVVLSVPFAQADFHADALSIFYNVGATVTTGLVTCGLTWMARSVWELRAARRALAEAAVAEERMRFARDLHDLLGLSLSAITLKTELTQRLMKADPARAATELMEIVEISRLALTDVRLVASGYRDLSLNEESRSAESVLAAADVDVRMDLHYGELPVEVRTVLATVLREGVTNVLRHSRGARCEITVRQHDNMVELEIVNDGVGVGDTGPGSGSGIRNLSDRVATVGGRLTAGLDSDGSFRLRALVPA